MTKNILVEIDLKGSRSFFLRWPMSCLIRFMNMIVSYSAASQQLMVQTFPVAPSVSSAQ